MTEQDPGLFRWDTGLPKASGLRGNQVKPLPHTPGSGLAAQATGPVPCWGWRMQKGEVGSTRPWHSPVGRPAPSPLSPPSLLGSPGVHRLPLFLQALAFPEGLGGQEGPCLLVCLEAPLENMDNTY